MESNIGSQITKTLTEGLSSFGSSITGEDSSRESELKARQAELDAQVKIAETAAASDVAKAKIQTQKLKARELEIGYKRYSRIAKGALLGGAAGFVAGTAIPGVGNVLGLFVGAGVGGVAADNIK